MQTLPKIQTTNEFDSTNLWPAGIKSEHQWTGLTKFHLLILVHKTRLFRLWIIFCAEKLYGDVTRIAVVVVVVIISLLCNAIQVGDQPLKTVKCFNPLQVVGTGEEQFKSFLFGMKNENKRNFQILRVQIPNWQHTQSVSQ